MIFFITKPRRDAVSENALNGASIEHNHGWDREIHLLQTTKRVKALLGPLNDSCGGQLIRQMDPQEFGTSEPL